MRLSRPVQFLLIAPLIGAFTYTFLGFLGGCIFGSGCSSKAIPMFFLYILGAYPIFGIPIYISGRFIYSKDEASNTYIALISSATMLVYTSPLVIFIVYRYLNFDRVNNDMVLSMTLASVAASTIAAAITGVLTSKVIKLPNKSNQSERF